MSHLENELGKESARKSLDRSAAVSSAVSSAPSMPSTPSGSEAADTHRCVQPTPELAAQSAINLRQFASASPSAEPRRQNKC